MSGPYRDKRDIKCPPALRLWGTICGSEGYYAEAETKATPEAAAAARC